MKKKIIVLSFLAIIGVIAILLIISMSQYINSHEYWYSFMTLENAIVTLVVLCFIMIAIVVGIIIVALKMKTSSAT